MFYFSVSYRYEARSREGHGLYEEDSQQTATSVQEIAIIIFVIVVV